MAKKSKIKFHRRLLGQTAALPRRVARWLASYWRHSWWHKTVVVLVALIALTVGTMYGIARWYIWTQSGTPVSLGASFIPRYAEQFGLDPKATLGAMLDDLHIKRLRLVSYWEDIETSRGHYDFSGLDWQFAKANEAGATVSLSIGLRQPRWPECHQPAWIDSSKPQEQWYPQLKQFMTAVVNRYKDNPALESYQLENEYFLKVFGLCKNFDRGRLVDEYNLVKRLDPHHTLIVSRSNNNIGTPVYAPTPDMYGVSVYKRVWVPFPFVKRYVEYPFPAWFYATIAGTEKLIKGKNTMIHELQAEPWPPYGAPITDTPTEELRKSLDARRLAGRFNYGKATGIRVMDLWGVEYWYYMKEKRGDPSLWNVAKTEFHKESQTAD